MLAYSTLKLSNTTHMHCDNIAKHAQSEEWIQFLLVPCCLLCPDTYVEIDVFTRLQLSL